MTTLKAVQAILQEEGINTHTLSLISIAVDNTDRSITLTLPHGEDTIYLHYSSQITKDRDAYYSRISKHYNLADPEVFSKLAADIKEQGREKA